MIMFIIVISLSCIYIKRHKKGLPVDRFTSQKSWRNNKKIFKSMSYDESMSKTFQDDELLLRWKYL